MNRPECQPHSQGRPCASLVAVCLPFDRPLNPGPWHRVRTLPVNVALSIFCTASSMTLSAPETPPRAAAPLEADREALIRSSRLGSSGGTLSMMRILGTFLASSRSWPSSSSFIPLSCARANTFVCLYVCRHACTGTRGMHARPGIPIRARAVSPARRQCVQRLSQISACKGRGAWRRAQLGGRWRRQAAKAGSKGARHAQAAGLVATALS